VQPAWVRPVEDVGHLRALIRYVLNQAERHGLGVHAALWSGSILPDLVGARWLPNLAPCLWRLMPTLDVSELLAAVGLTGRLDPLPLPELWTVGAAGLVAAAERAAGVSAAGAEARRGASRVRARRAAAKLGRLAGIPTCQMAAALGLSEGGTRKAAAREVPTELLAATRLRVALDRLARPASGGVGVERGI